MDTVLTKIDEALRVLFPSKATTISKPSPGKDLAEVTLTEQEKKHIIGCMRVNHAGEVCAQALYQGQALTAKLATVKEHMTQAASEEVDHLAWCEERLSELGSKPSLLNPLWYASSFLLGALAGLAGDAISLGFVAETELQVSAHLQKHLKHIPAADKKTKAILVQMHADESQHAATALEAGGLDLPAPLKTIMYWASQLMTRTSYYL